MICTEARVILGLSEGDYSLEHLRKQYHKLALKHHPDKNGNTPESNETFRRIHEAYCLLSFNAGDSEVEDLNGEVRENVSDEYVDPYLRVLKEFIMSVFETKYRHSIFQLVCDILSAGKQLSVQLFADLPKDTVLQVYSFLSEHRSVLHLSNDFIEQLRALVLRKYDHMTVYRLNPSLVDLMECNFYKLYVGDQLFLVPLWQNESYFDGSGCEIIVLCEPDLPDHISLDEENQVHIRFSVSFDTLASLFREKKAVMELSLWNDNNNPLLSIPLNQITFSAKQVIVIPNKGISKHLHHIDQKTDVFVHLTIV